MRTTNVHVPTSLSAALHPRLRQTASYLLPILGSHFAFRFRGSCPFQTITFFTAFSDCTILSSVWSVYNVFGLYFPFELLFQGRNVFLAPITPVCFSLAMLFQRTVISDFYPRLRHGQSHFYCPFLSHKDTQTFSIPLFFRVKNSKYFLIRSRRAFSASVRIDCPPFTKSVRQ